MNLKGMLYRLRLANYNQLLDIAGRLGKWALLNKLDLMGYPQRDRVGALLDREIAALGPSVEAYLTHQKTEIEILSARLSRRYDPGALPAEEEDFWTQEAQRQREARAANPEPIQELSETQKVALEFQKRAVKRTIENA